MKVLVCSLLFVGICTTQEDMRTEVPERIGNWEFIYNWLATIGVASAAIVSGSRMGLHESMLNTTSRT